MKSLHTLAPIQSPYNSHMTSKQYTWYSMSQCWNQHSRIQFQIGFNQCPYPSLSKTNLNFKFPTSLMPRLTTDVAADFNILSDGWATKALMKKPLGSMPMSSEMLLNLLQTFTWPTHPSWALSQIIEVQTTSLLLKFSHFITSSTKSYYSFRVESTSVFTNPTSNLFTIHSNKRFCCSIRAFLLSLLSFNSTSNSLVWSKLSFNPISSSVCLSSSLRVEGPLGSTPLTSVSASDSSTCALLLDLLPFPAVLRIFWFQTRTPPNTVHTTFRKEQRSHDLWHAPSAGQMQYCLWCRHWSHMWSPLVPVS